MKEEEIIDLLQKRPAVHKLCYGAFIQEVIQIEKNVYAIPLRQIGYQSQANYLVQYSKKMVGVPVDQNGIEELIKQGDKSFPVIAIVCISENDGTAEQLENISNDSLNSAMKILSWASGDYISAFGVLTLTKSNSYFRLIPPHSNNRLRLGFGNTGNDYKDQIIRLNDAIQTDEHFNFAVTLYQNALKDTNHKFQIASFFSCLECLAYKLKSKDRPSRKAIKYLLGMEDGAFCEVVFEGIKYRFDAIEIAGRIRDKFYHGIDFTEADLNASSKNIFDLYQYHSEHIASPLKGYCEIEIARWANGASKGLLK